MYRGTKHEARPYPSGITQDFFVMLRYRSARLHQPLVLPKLRTRRGRAPFTGQDQIVRDPLDGDTVTSDESLCVRVWIAQEAEEVGGDGDSNGTKESKKPSSSNFVGGVRGSGKHTHGREHQVSLRLCMLSKVHHDNERRAPLNKNASCSLRCRAESSNVVRRILYLPCVRRGLENSTQLLLLLLLLRLVDARGVHIGAVQSLNCRIVSLLPSLNEHGMVSYLFFPRRRVSPFVPPNPSVPRTYVTHWRRG